MYKMHKDTNNQDGFAAIVIAMVLILVLSLTTVGFAQLMSHEQRQSLDRQLSSQAYYAAESGVNIAAKEIQTGMNQNKTECGGQSTLGASQLATSGYMKLSDNTASSIPCLLIDQTPPEVRSSLQQGEQKVYQMSALDAAKNPVAAGSVKVTWYAKSGSVSKNYVSSSMCRNPKPADNWTGPNGPGLTPLRVQLLPLIKQSGVYTRASLTNDAYTVYLCPTTSGGTTSYYAADGDHSSITGDWVDATCDAALKCSVTINGLTRLNQSTYFVAVTPLYGDADVDFSLTASTGAQAFIGGAQALIDSTGKAQDTLRRIQVRVSLRNSYNAQPGNAVNTSSDICKQLKLMPEASGSSSRNGGTCNVIND